MLRCRRRQRYGRREPARRPAGTNAFSLHEHRVRSCRRCALAGRCGWTTRCAIRACPTRRVRTTPAYGLIAFAAVPLPPGIERARGQPRAADRRARGQRAAALRGRTRGDDRRRAAKPSGSARRASSTPSRRNGSGGWSTPCRTRCVLTRRAEQHPARQPVHAERLLKPGADDSAGKRRAIEMNNFLLSAALSSFALEQARRHRPRPDAGRPDRGHRAAVRVIRQPATNLRTGERGTVSVLKDVTDLRRAADELTQHAGADSRAAGEETRRERDRLNLILASVADPIVVTDPDGPDRPDEPAGRAAAAAARVRPGARRCRHHLSSQRRQASPPSFRSCGWRRRRYMQRRDRS